MCVRACVSACVCVCVWSRVTVLRAALHTRTEQSSSWPAVPLAASSMSSLLFSPSLCSSFLSHPLLFPLLQPFFIIFTLFLSLFVPLHSHIMSLSIHDSFNSSPPLLYFYPFSLYRCTALLFSHLFPTVFIQSILSTPPLHNYKSSLDKTLVFLFSWTSQHNRSTTSGFFFSSVCFCHSLAFSHLSLFGRHARLELNTAALSSLSSSLTVY